MKLRQRGPIGSSQDIPLAEADFLEGAAATSAQPVRFRAAFPGVCAENLQPASSVRAIFRVR